VALVVLVRPLAGYVALTPFRGRGERSLSGGERWAVAFFGVRGIGSIYYLAYASGQSRALGEDWIWSTVAFTIVLSVFIHGVLASPVMRRLNAGVLG
jgi:NhaP-type Na+/H+ or K+/H+ antiporter